MTITSEAQSVSLNQKPFLAGRRSFLPGETAASETKAYLFGEKLISFIAMVIACNAVANFLAQRPSFVLQWPFVLKQKLIF